MGDNMEKEETKRIITNLRMMVFRFSLYCLIPNITEVGIIAFYSDMKYNLTYETSLHGLAYIGSGIYI